jgi:hypothetical protein
MTLLQWNSLFDNRIGNPRRPRSRTNRNGAPGRQCSLLMAADTNGNTNKMTRGLSGQK